MGKETFDDDERWAKSAYRIAVCNNTSRDKVAAEIEDRLTGRPKALAIAKSFLADLPPEHPFWKNRAGKGVDRSDGSRSRFGERRRRGQVAPSVGTADLPMTEPHGDRTPCGRAIHHRAIANIAHDIGIGDDGVIVVEFVFAKWAENQPVGFDRHHFAQCTMLVDCLGRKAENQPVGAKVDP